MNDFDEYFPYATMKDGRILFRHHSFQDALDLAKKWIYKDWDSIVIVKFDRSGSYKAIGTVRMQNGKPYWLAKRYDLFNGRIAVPIKKGKKKERIPAPFGL